MRKLLPLLIAALLVMLLPQPGFAAPGLVQTMPQATAAGPMVDHIVVQGQGLSSIARTYCTTAEEIYAANRGVIGGNPDMLRVGTVLKIRNLCNRAGGDGKDMGPDRPPAKPSGESKHMEWGYQYGSAEEYLTQFEVYDRGPRKHAMGLLNGMYYIVAPNDTLYSIVERFGIAAEKLQEANGIRKTKYLTAGTHLYIPGLKEAPGTCKDASIQITRPSEGALLGGSFRVDGRARNLKGNQVDIRVLAGTIILVEQTVALQGSNLDNGGEGVFQANVTVTGYHHTATIKVFNRDCKNAHDSVEVMIRPCRPYVTITTPRTNDTLPQTFTVVGTGGCLFEGNVVVRAVSSAGAELASVPVTLEGSDVGAGGDGTYSVSLTVNDYLGNGRIEVSNQESGVNATVNVRFGVPPSLRITEPQNDAVLGPSFTVSGQGTNLAGSNVRIRVIKNNGDVLVNWTQVPLNSDGTFSNQFTVSGYVGPGRIEVESPADTNVKATVSVAQFDTATTTTDDGAFLSITSPASAASLPVSFTVTGRGRGLFEETVVVEAFSDRGSRLARQTATLQGANVGSGGEGVYEVGMTVNEFTRGYILVTSPQSNVPAQRVDVGFNGARYPQSEFTYRDIPYGECRATTLPSAVAYVTPGSGAAVNVPSSGAVYVATRVVDRSGVLWYAFDEPLVGADMYSWISETSLDLRGECDL